MHCDFTPVPGTPRLEERGEEEESADANVRLRSDGTVLGDGSRDEAPKRPRLGNVFAPGDRCSACRSAVTALRKPSPCALDLFHAEALEIVGENPRNGVVEKDNDLVGEALAMDDEHLDDWYAEDDVKGGALPAGLVRKARQCELEYLRDRKVYQYAVTRDAIQRTGRQPLRLKWIDTDKGGVGHSKIRSRLVCTEVRRPGMEPIFAATPPLDSLRALVAKAATHIDKKGELMCLQLVDVSRAHFYAPAVREVYVQIPEGDPQHGKPGVCGRLLRTMYGTLDAAEQWAAHYTRVLCSAGFEHGAASPCHFWHKDRDLWILVHGDDFFSAGSLVDQEFLRQTLSVEYQLKCERAGPRELRRLRDGGDVKPELRVLGRVIRYTDRGLTCEPDAQHLDMVVSALGLCDAKGAASPGARDVSARSAENLRRLRLELSKPAASDAPDSTDTKLDPEQSRQFLSHSARLNYYAMDRVDILFAVKELMRRVSSPTSKDWMALKHLTRYLMSMPRVVARYDWGPLSTRLEVYVDANWAGCLRSRKSTVGGVVLWNGQFLKAWAKTMPIIALSSGESELAAVTKGASEGLGAQAALMDFGFKVDLVIKSDATAAIGMCKRQGLGRVRHLATADLWVQQLVRMKKCTLLKWPGKQNPADLMTKYLPRDQILSHLAFMHMECLEGRAAVTPVRAGAPPISRASKCDEDDVYAESQICNVFDQSFRMGSSDSLSVDRAAERGCKRSDPMLGTCGALVWADMHP